MLTAAQIFDSDLIQEIAEFAANNQRLGPRWKALHEALSTRVLPARARYRAALDAAAREKAQLEARQADAVKLREALTEQLRELDRAIAAQYPAERAAATEAPARLAEEANELLSTNDRSLVEAAIQSFKAFRA